MIRYYQIPLKWQPLSIKNEIKYQFVLLKLANCFERWKGTPYMSGNQRRQGGVDCVRWVTAVLDWMYERPPTDIKTLPSDASFHDRIGAMRAFVTIKRLYPNCRLVKNEPLEPGDLVVVGSPGGGPGHAMMVGTEPYSLWHCTPNNGVNRAGWALVVGQQKIFRVYRAKDRSRAWA